MDNPSAAPTVRHLPLHRGGLTSGVKALQSIVLFVRGVANHLKPVGKVQTPPAKGVVAVHALPLKRLPPARELSPKRSDA